MKSLRAVVHAVTRSRGDGQRDVQPGRDGLPQRLAGAGEQRHVAGAQVGERGRGGVLAGAEVPGGALAEGGGEAEGGGGAAEQGVAGADDVEARAADAREQGLVVEAVVAEPAAAARRRG
jgi:hypothetical protein